MKVFTCSSHVRLRGPEKDEVVTEHLLLVTRFVSKDPKPTYLTFIFTLIFTISLDHAWYDLSSYSIWKMVYLYNNQKLLTLN